MWRVLTGCEYRSDRAATLNVVIRWKKGLPAKRDEPWFLMTDLAGNAVRLTDLYARRMAVEELFRDGESRRNGFALRAAQLTKAERLDRLLLVVALAYLLLTGLGRVARRLRRPGFWCSSNRARVPGRVAGSWATTGPRANAQASAMRLRCSACTSGR